jgi:hypothetical protein
MGRESRRCGLGLHGGELGEESVRLTKSARTSLRSLIPTSLVFLILLEDDEEISEGELMIEHNLVNYSLILPYPLVLSNHTIGLIQVVTQVKLPVHQYVLSYPLTSFIFPHLFLPRSTYPTSWP